MGMTPNDDRGNVLSSPNLIRFRVKEGSTSARGLVSSTDEEFKMIRFSWWVLGISAALTFSGAGFAAQRTFVSVLGSDANITYNCSNSLPCRGFTAALGVTDAGGEIVVKDSGGYGPVIITKSVSIIANDGVYAGISVFSGTGIEIATPGVDVLLKGLTLNGLGGYIGISMSDGIRLTVLNCLVRNFSLDGGVGISVDAPGLARVFDTVLLENATGVAIGNGATAVISRTRFFGNALGLDVLAGAADETTTEVSASEAGQNLTGFHARALAGGTVKLNVKDSVLAKNSGVGGRTTSTGGTVLSTYTANLISGNSGAGLYAEGSGAKIVAIGNTLSQNSWGLVQTGGSAVVSTGDNAATDNTSGSSSGTITPLSKI